MDDGHHADGSTFAKPNSFSSKHATFSTTTFSTPCYQQTSMMQSQILTPPVTPPRSPHPSHPAMSAKSIHKPAHNDRLASRVHFDLHMSIHRSTSTTIECSMSESALWTLPGADNDGDGPQVASTPKATKPENRWSRLLQSAASSNRHRHRARLEGDGWAFVGGRYSDEMQELNDESAGSVDEEFDVVVLARETVGC